MFPKTVIVASILVAFATVTVAVLQFERDPVFRQALREADGDVVAALKEVGYVTCNDAGKPVYVSLNRTIRTNRKTIYMNNGILSYLREFDTIKTLIIGTKTNINDSGMAHIAKLKNLELLNIRRVPISSKGLEELKSLDKLQVLFIDRTHLSDQDILDFQDAVPSCSIRFSSG